MNPEVTAAIIAASVSFLTLIGTLAAQYFGRRATSKQLDRTLTEQRTRTLNERFGTAAEQLGSEKPAVQLAGVYAMAGLGDDWEENRQTCVDVLCAYLRMPYEPDPGQDAPGPQGLAFQAIREVRHTVIRVITAHLKKDAAMSWQGLSFDFTGVVFDGGDFSDAQFSGGEVSFIGARFSGGRVDFSRAWFSGAQVYFPGAQFSGGEVYFSVARFSGGVADFSGSRFSGGVVDFSEAQFSGSSIHFNVCQFSGGVVRFSGSRFSGGVVDFIGARFSGGVVDFSSARPVLMATGGDRFSGGVVDFSNPSDWSFPPTFPWTDTPPAGVTLPRKERQSGP